MKFDKLADFFITIKFGENNNLKTAWKENKGETNNNRGEIRRELVREPTPSIHIYTGCLTI